MNLSAATEAYASKLAASARAREQLDDEEFALFERDLATARREMEIVWYRTHPEGR